MPTTPVELADKALSATVFVVHVIVLVLGQQV